MYLSFPSSEQQPTDSASSVYLLFHGSRTGYYKDGGQHHRLRHAGDSSMVALEQSAADQQNHGLRHAGDSFMVALKRKTTDREDDGQHSRGSNSSNILRERTAADNEDDALYSRGFL